MYVPLLSSPRETPSYLSMDRKHPWHTAALQATAIESLTLPSRLRRSQGVNAASLDQLAIALNPSDERKIAQARLEISGAQVQANGAATLSQVVHDCDLSPAENDQDARTFSELSIYRGHEEESEAMGNGHDEDIEHYRRYVYTVQQSNVETNTTAGSTHSFAFLYSTAFLRYTASKILQKARHRFVLS